MLVRRIATVTICAPEASMAARVCAKSLYFPVPTSRREENFCPAISRTSFTSATSHCDHDFEAVAVREQCRAVRPARHDLAVALHRDLLARQGHRQQQLRERQRAF